MFSYKFVSDESSSCKKQSLEDFAWLQSNSRTPLEDWIDQLKLADWQQPSDIKRTYNTADLLGAGSNRVVFDIGGNNYRLSCKYAFGLKQIHLFVCWIGTHADYDRLCKINGQYTINLF
ncbi:type II toxin-antitoxin system HigB family toxin [Pedobacter duraquae]|uniref:type II toxin-antitoxin system HigB family toxin n=1 Tax=Pedobacter duraquae TaxID=425511 RepID=UPI003743F91B